MEVRAGDANTPCRLFDADGVEIKFATWANLDTGDVTKYVIDATGKKELVRNTETGGLEFRKERRQFKAPLRIEKIKA